VGGEQRVGGRLLDLEQDVPTIDSEHARRPSHAGQAERQHDRCRAVAVRHQVEAPWLLIEAEAVSSHVQRHDRQQEAVGSQRVRLAAATDDMESRNDKREGCARKNQIPRGDSLAGEPGIGLRGQSLDRERHDQHSEEDVHGPAEPSSRQHRADRMNGAGHTVTRESESDPPTRVRAGGSQG